MLGLLRPRERSYGYRIPVDFARCAVSSETVVGTLDTIREKQYNEWQPIKSQARIITVNTLCGQVLADRRQRTSKILAMSDIAVQNRRAVEILDLLGNATNRSILAVTTTDPKSVPELAEECDIPTSTIYRKIEVFSDVGLVKKQIRIKSETRNVREYSLDAAALTLTVDASENSAFDCRIERITKVSGDSGRGGHATDTVQLANGSGGEFHLQNGTRQTRLDEFG